MRQLLQRRILISALILLPPLAGCSTGTVDSANESSSEEFQLASTIQEKVEAGEPLDIYVSAPDTALPFATPQRVGTERAGQEIDGVRTHFIGPATGRPEDQASELQTLIVQGQVDGIAVNASSNDALRPIYAQAFDAGIPMISYSTDNPDSAQLGFVGSDVAAGGTLEGQELGRLLDGQTGKVVVFSVAPGAAFSSIRFEAMKAELPAGVELVGPIDTTPEPAQMFTAVQNAMAANGDAIAIASVDCCSFTAAAKWAEQQPEASRPLVVGFDALQQTLDYIDSGVVSFAISQQPAEQTFQAVQMLKDIAESGEPTGDEPIDLILVTRENVDSIQPEG